MELEKKLYRSRKVKSLAGVCGGLAAYFNVDVTVIRLLWALAAVVYGTGLFAYIVAAIVIPLEPEEV